MSLNLINTIADFLRERPEERFTAKEIANYIYENYPEQCKQKQKKSKAKVTPLDNTKNLLQQIQKFRVFPHIFLSFFPSISSSSTLTSIFLSFPYTNILC